VTRIRRVGVAVALALLMATALVGTAYAATLVDTAGQDQLIGTRNADTIYGLGGWDYIVGKPAADELHGGKGGDTIEGSYGNDYLVGGRGNDELEAGYGTDRIEAADGRYDFVDCGPGENEHASVDEHDYVRDCEVVNGKRQ
jgi:Ca2+-binding RTX toxin-like protein